jgi:hypothetical protein
VLPNTVIPEDSTEEKKDPTDNINGDNSAPAISEIKNDC